MSNIKGILAASITPLKEDYSPDLDAIPEYLKFLAGRGCNGALLLGTTGEGPSFSFQQRIAVMNAAGKVKEEHPDFVLLAGTSTPSLDETINLTKAAYEIGMDGTLVLPPYYFRSAGSAGLLEWFNQVVKNSVPDGGKFYLYHIPGLSGIGLSMNMIEQLVDSNPRKFSGLKDSSGDLDYARKLGKRFGYELEVFTGNDRLLAYALDQHASGCITALANLIAPDLRELWNEHEAGNSTQIWQNNIDTYREISERFQPFPPLIKLLLHQTFKFPHWPVCPPLEEFSPQKAIDVQTSFKLA